MRPMHMRLSAEGAAGEGLRACLCTEMRRQTDQQDHWGWHTKECVRYSLRMEAIAVRAIFSATPRVVLPGR